MKVALKFNKIPEDTPKSLNPNWNNIAYDTKKIWIEYQLINRILYRSKNQHKASFSLQHLKEVKRLGERIGKLEMWLKANYAESGEMLFNFLGYLNTLKLLIDKAIEACRKTFYFYCHYLDQALFVTLALTVVASVSTLHSELMQWTKYIRLLFAGGMDKLKKSFGADEVIEWCKEHGIEEKFKDPIKTEELKPPVSKSETLDQSTSKTIPAKNKSGNSHSKSLKPKKLKTSSGGNEIDDIFGGM